MTDMCPSCGFNLASDETLVRGDWHLDPRGVASFKGKRLLLRPAQAQILLSLAKAEGRVLSTDALLFRTSESDNPNVLASQIAQMRKSLRAEGVPDPIETVISRGYRWRDAA